MTKQVQRDDMKNRLASLEKSQYHSYSKEIESRFLQEENVVNASIIGITISSFPEVETEGIIQKVWDLGKTVVVPKCAPKERTMTFYSIDSFDQLETVYMQLLEPNPLLCTPVSSSEIDVLVVPGIVYSDTGYRIGYGGGYYDRFLMQFSGQTISLAFDFQVCNHIERESFDLPVDKLITNTQIISCKINREEETK
ncbi:5-formyltetrahydrofolate cyclo-ligase [Psychrobacillus vulpis]|uniref:5-formyltetrahydrofolate cyclo-ligase n=1 Tax=Psychrobacillus vulpis TaxID=2325572 RepID=A0A544TQ14_9BACI|nr:5-formyltetrahydrofolate cyclo-ligase [Psychrobacillus vulpis]TQR19547.1 5-formyltetrahydrofolate cyclo-ligase [Psychrobacillus vulpis]